MSHLRKCFLSCFSFLFGFKPDGNPSPLVQTILCLGSISTRKPNYQKWTISKPNKKNQKKKTCLSHLHGRLSLFHACPFQPHLQEQLTSPLQRPWQPRFHAMLSACQPPYFAYHHAMMSYICCLPEAFVVVKSHRGLAHHFMPICLTTVCSILPAKKRSHPHLMETE